VPTVTRTTTQTVNGLVDVLGPLVTGVATTVNNLPKPVLTLPPVPSPPLPGPH
jgi:hypothetical protein